MMIVVVVVVVEGCLVEDNWLFVKYCAAYIPSPAWSAPLFHWRWGMPGSLSPDHLSSPQLTDAWNTETSFNLSSSGWGGYKWWTNVMYLPVIIRGLNPVSPLSNHGILAGWTQIPVCCDYVNFCRNPMVCCELFMIVAWNLNELWWYYIKGGW